MKAVRAGLPMFPMLTLANTPEEARQYYAAYGDIEEIEGESAFWVKGILDSEDVFVWETELPDETPYTEDVDPKSGVILRIVEE